MLSNLLLLQSQLGKRQSWELLASCDIWSLLQYYSYNKNDKIILQVFQSHLADVDIRSSFHWTIVLDDWIQYSEVGEVQGLVFRLAGTMGLKMNSFALSFWVNNMWSNMKTHTDARVCPPTSCSFVFFSCPPFSGYAMYCAMAENILARCA